MRAAVAGAVELVLSAERREHRKLAVHGNNRQTIPRYALVWIPADGALYAASEPQMRPSQGPSIDASDVFGANLPDTKHEQETPPAPDLSISASEIDNWSTQPSVVRGYHVHSHAARVSVSGGNHGLVQPQSIILAVVQQYGGRLLRRGSERGHRKIWQA